MEDLPWLLKASRAGDRHALGRAFVIAYDQLHYLARNRLRREQVDVVLDATSLVHECYLRLMKNRSLKLYDYSHLLGYTAQVMRSIIIDSARKRLVQRRFIVLDSSAADVDSSEIEVRLEHLLRSDKRVTQIIELKCLRGLTFGQIAKHLHLGERTVRRDWKKAQTYLSESRGR
jgi:RNA polymerase sigma factor (TIGR02999 family)